MHFKSQQRRTGLSRESPLSETIRPPLIVSDLLDVARYSFANLPYDEQLLVSLSYTTKHQHVLKCYLNDAFSYIYYHTQ